MEGFGNALGSKLCALVASHPQWIEDTTALIGQETNPIALAEAVEAVRHMISEECGHPDTSPIDNEI